MLVKIYQGQDSDTSFFSLTLQIYVDFMILCNYSKITWFPSFLIQWKACHLKRRNIKTEKWKSAFFIIMVKVRNSS